MAVSTTYIDSVLTFLKAEASSIEALGEALRAVPETGFCEEATGRILEERLKKAGIACETGLALTGLRARVGPAPSAGTPEIVLLADMDALPTAGSATAAGAVAHSCGHNAQMAAMLSAFLAIARSAAPETQGFTLSFLAAPAEEYCEMDRRMELRAAGKIRYLSGKQELIRLGAFDGATLVLKYHSMPDSAPYRAVVNGTLNGFMAKRALFTGKAAHSGAHPEDGINALNAASLAIQAIHCQRETFVEADRIRVHPVLRPGPGTTVNTVPDNILLETYVRGAEHRAVSDAARKVDRALAAGAIAVGASVRILDMPGYQACHPWPALGTLIGEEVLRYLPREAVDFDEKGTASDDIGDVSCLVPVGTLGWPGFSGTIHGCDFVPSSPYKAYVEPALIIAATALRLGANGAALAKDACAAFTPRFSKESYLAALDAQFSDRHIAWDPSM